MFFFTSQNKNSSNIGLGGRLNELGLFTNIYMRSNKKTTKDGSVSLHATEGTH